MTPRACGVALPTTVISVAAIKAITPIVILRGIVFV
jgi:hypothetical protein